MRFFATIFVFIFCSLGAYAQSFRLFGKIKNRNISVAQAMVSVYNSENSNLVAQLETNSLGDYFIELNSQKIHLIIWADGFTPKYIEPFDFQQDTELNIELTEQPIELNDVVVVAKKIPQFRVENSKMIFQPQNIALSGANILEMLQKTPMLFVDNQYNISIGGKKGVLVLLNSKPTYMQGDDLANYLKTIPSSQVKNIEIILTPPAEFDAEGAAGVVNIVLKNNVLEGTFLSANTGVAYGENLRNNFDFLLQHNTEKLQIRSNYAHQIGNVNYHYGSTRYQNSKKYDNISEDTDKRKTILAGLGLDYSLNKKTSLGLDLSANSVFGKGSIFTENKIYSADNQLERTLFSQSDYFFQKANRYSANAYYQFLPDEKQAYNFAVDYAYFDGGSGIFQPNQIQFPNAKITQLDEYISENQRKIHILSTQFKYKKSYKNSDLNTGVKYSLVKSKNKFNFSENKKGIFILDQLRSNDFLYNEQILASFIDFNYMIKENFSIKMGIRTEYTLSESDLFYRKNDSEKSQKTPRDYFHFFPSLQLNYNRFSLGYSKRISRPVYQDLNPFDYPLDGLSSWRGNPFLLPQNIHKIALNKYWKHWSLSLSYSFINNYSSQITNKLSSEKVIMIPQNIGSQEHFSADVFSELDLFSWWKISFNSSLFFVKNSVKLEDVNHFKLSQFSGSFSLQNTLNFNKTTSMELNYWYASKRLSNANELFFPTSYLDIGVKKNFLKNKLILVLSVSDIFEQNHWNNQSHLPNLDIISYGFGEQRQVKLNISYKIGSKKEVKNEVDFKEVERL